MENEGTFKAGMRAERANAVRYLRHLAQAEQEAGERRGPFWLNYAACVLEDGLQDAGCLVRAGEDAVKAIGKVL